MHTHPRTILVIFGGTGDLFRRKIAPSLFTLFEEGKLPKDIHIIGTGRSEYSDDSYRAFVHDALKSMLSVDAPSDFLDRFSYIAGDINEHEMYAQIERVVEEKHPASSDEAVSIVLYFSIAPDLYGTISHHIATDTKILSRPPEQVQLLIEKPIGSNGVTSAKLNDDLLTVFREEQIVRIEHYLTKETLKALPRLRRQDHDLESLLSREHIASIGVYLWETIGVEKRGAFYDAVGVLRDVGQNHLLEMLAITCMDLPLRNEGLQEARTAFLESLPSGASALSSRRFQYDGYQGITGVQAHSTTETAYGIKTVLAGSRWDGVTVEFSAGKRMGEKKKMLELTCKEHARYKNKALTKIEIWIDPEQVRFVFLDGTVTTIDIRPGHVQKYQYVEEYARIIGAAIEKDHEYSVSAREVAALWRFVDPYLSAWEKNEVPLERYAPDTTPDLSVL
jgi:glucose-6-phosphate 1-dehydrogenase